MADRESVQVQCGACGQGFQILRAHFGQAVACPHCGQRVRFQAPAAEDAKAALEELGGADRLRKPVRARLHTPVAPGGLKSKNVAIVWGVVLVIGLGAAIAGIAYVYGPGQRPPEEALAPEPPPGPTGPTYLDTTTRVYNRYGDPVEQGATVAPPEGGVTAQPGVPAPVTPQDAAIPVTVGRMLHGYKNDTTSYVAGRVANRSGQPVVGLQIRVHVFGDDEESIGTAYAFIRRLEPGEDVPYVAVWEHDPLAKAKTWYPDHTVDPTLVQGTPVQCEMTDVPWAKPDAGGFDTTGWINIPVMNTSPHPVGRFEVSAVLYDGSRGVVSAVRDEVIKTVLPGETAELEVRYEKAPRSLIANVDAHVQAVAQP